MHSLYFFSYSFLCSTLVAYENFKKILTMRIILGWVLNLFIHSFLDTSEGKKEKKRKQFQIKVLKCVLYPPKKLLLAYFHYFIINSIIIIIRKVLYNNGYSVFTFYTRSHTLSQLSLSWMKDMKEWGTTKKWTRREEKNYCKIIEINYVLIKNYIKTRTDDLCIVSYERKWVLSQRVFIDLNLRSFVLLSAFMWTFTVRLLIFFKYMNMVGLDCSACK